MDKREVKSIIESLLFIWGEPLSASDIADVLEFDVKEIDKLIKDMMDTFNYERRGLQIVQINKSYQLTTRSEHYEWISKLCTPKSDKKLSNATLETLSIIAYKQPITRMEIEALRGVKCDRSIRNLLHKNLVKEVGRLDRTGKPIIYGTTDDFLKYFGLTSLDQLPKLEKFNHSQDENEGQIELNIELDD